MNTTLISIGGRLKVNPLEVIALVADANYSLVYMTDEQVLFVATTLKVLENRFRSNAFVRTHKSYLINLCYVADYDHENHLFVKMQNDIRATISRRKKEIFIEKMTLINFNKT